MCPFRVSTQSAMRTSLSGLGPIEPGTRHGWSESGSLRPIGEFPGIRYIRFATKCQGELIQAPVGPFRTGSA